MQKRKRTLAKTAKEVCKNRKRTLAKQFKTSKKTAKKQPIKSKMIGVLR
ncbi:MAG: hypothetical protein RSB59_03635 [Clostridia bacterium]